MATLISIRNIVKTYEMGDTAVHALNGVSLEIQKNEYVAIMGPSGSGKSTLMNILGCLDTPTSGIYEFKGVNVSDMLLLGILDGHLPAEIEPERHREALEDVREEGIFRKRFIRLTAGTSPGRRRGR